MSAAPKIAPIIDWQRVCLNLRTHYKPLARIAVEDIGCDVATLQRLARGDVAESKWTICTRLLDLHYDKCPALHRRGVIMAPEQANL